MSAQARKILKQCEHVLTDAQMSEDEYLAAVFFDQWQRPQDA
jgi:hypothetical protein